MNDRLSALPEEDPVPDPDPRPTNPEDRLVALDMLRGVAILGILLLNIRSFGLSTHHYTTPYAGGTPLQVDLWAFLVTQTFADGKFLTLFAILFGAGLVLSARRFDEAGQKGRASIVQYKRLGWLAVFGLLHILLLWHGDVLLLYALVGMAIFPARRLPLAAQAGLAAGLIGITFMLMGGSWAILQMVPAEMSAESFPPPETRIEPGEAAAYAGGYLDALQYRLGLAAFFQPMILLFFGWHVGGLVLLGMIGYRTGFLRSTLSTRTYGIVALATLPAFALAGVLVWLGNGVRFSGVHWELLGVATWNVLNVICATCIAAAVQWGSRLFQSRALSKGLAAVGRMAFTNYLMQSVLCTTLFYGYGLGQWGRHGYATLLLFVLGVWLLQVPLSVWWLNRFRYGPMEWLWRSLVYRRLSM